MKHKSVWMPLLALISSLVWSQEKAEFASGSSIVRRVQGGFRECRGQLGSDREEKNPLSVLSPPSRMLIPTSLNFGMKTIGYSGSSIACCICVQQCAIAFMLSVSSDFQPTSSLPSESWATLPFGVFSPALGSAPSGRF